MMYECETIQAPSVCMHVCTLVQSQGALRLAGVEEGLLVCTAHIAHIIPGNAVGKHTYACIGGMRATVDALRKPWLSPMLCCAVLCCAVLCCGRKRACFGAASMC